MWQSMLCSMTYKKLPINSFLSANLNLLPAKDPINKFSVGFYRAKNKTNTHLILQN